jgi:F0F1-type ATP synthase membrane subunit b/b'
MADKKSWMDSISETVDKASKAASEAWDGTADARKDAWDKTKAAVESASEAIDQGVERARDSFKGDGERPADAADTEVSQEPEEAVPPAETEDVEVWEAIEDLEGSDEADTI